MRNRKRRGSVIIVVLVLITLASLLLGRFMEDNALELSVATREGVDELVQLTADLLFTDKYDVQEIPR